MRVTWIAIVASSLTGIGAVLIFYYGGLEVDKGTEVPTCAYFKM